MIPRSKVNFTSRRVEDMQDPRWGGKEYEASITFHTAMIETPGMAYGYPGPSEEDIKDELYRRMMYGIFKELRAELAELQRATEELNLDSRCNPHGGPRSFELAKAQRDQFNKVFEMTYGDC